MAYTTIDDPGLYFNTVLISGDSGTQAITGVGFEPSFTWNKTRNAADNHVLVDSVRGDKALRSNVNIAEYDTGVSWQFNSDGFTMTGTTGELNYSGRTYASWNWKAGTTGSGTTTGTGTGKAYSYSVNTTAGFSIVKYKGNGTSGHTIPHHLGAVPKFIIVKRMDGVSGWHTYHGSPGATQRFSLNETDATDSDSTAWNNTTPTSSVFTVGNSGTTNVDDADTIAYCFAEKQGYSKFGSYTGNGNADGTFVYTGFKPAWVMWKRTDATNDWYIYDNKRNSFNTMGRRLEANQTDDEVNSGSAIVDFVSNGYKFRGTDSSWNVSGGTFIYMAFAEAPFVNSNGVPCNAR